MININNVHLNSDYSIVANVSTTSGHHITKLLLWTMDTFKDYSKALDFTTLLNGTANTENIVITANQIEPGATHLSGIYFLEFTSDEPDSTSVCIENANVNIAIVADLTPYNECLLNKTLANKVVGCSEEIKFSECEDCQDSSNDIRYISTLLKSLDIAIRYGFLEETITIFKALDKICEICHNCPDYGDSSLVAGYNYGTINNSIILL